MIKRIGCRKMSTGVIDSYRTTMPNDEFVLILMGSVVMGHKSYDRILPRITCDANLFPKNQTEGYENDDFYDNKKIN